MKNKNIFHDRFSMHIEEIGQPLLLEKEGKYIVPRRIVQLIIKINAEADSKE